MHERSGTSFEEVDHAEVGRIVVRKGGRATYDDELGDDMKITLAGVTRLRERRGASGDTDSDSNELALEQGRRQAVIARDQKEAEDPRTASATDGYRVEAFRTQA